MEISEEADEEMMIAQDDKADEIGVVGSWGTKIDAVVRQILGVLVENKRAKSLVFSQWTVVLEIVAKALSRNNIPFRFLGSTDRKAQRAVEDFKHDPSVAVLLLPIHKGSRGLNLTEAQNVFLVEPLLDAAAEVQAIGRVHRIGQLHPTTVYRFVIDDTIEASIKTLSSSVYRPVGPCSSASSSGNDNNILLRTDLSSLVNFSSSSLE